MPATSGPTPGQVRAWGLDTFELGTGAETQNQIKARTEMETGERQALLYCGVGVVVVL